MKDIQKYGWDFAMMRLEKWRVRESALNTYGNGTLLTGL
jgi:hypothetical protein